MIGACCMWHLQDIIYYISTIWIHHFHNNNRRVLCSNSLRMITRFFNYYERKVKLSKISYSRKETFPRVYGTTLFINWIRGLEKFLGSLWQTNTFGKFLMVTPDSTLLERKMFSYRPYEGAPHIQIGESICWSESICTKYLFLLLSGTNYYIICYCQKL